MPFTISHVAAVLPFHRALRRQGYFSAAIVGSMVPDLGFLLPLHLPRSATHTRGAVHVLPAARAGGLLAVSTADQACVVCRVAGPLARSPARRTSSGPHRELASVVGRVCRRAGRRRDPSRLGWLHARGRPWRAHVAVPGRLRAAYRGACIASVPMAPAGQQRVGIVVVLVAVWRGAAAMAAPAGRPNRSQARGLFPELGERERQAWLAAYLLPPIACWYWAAGFTGTPWRHQRLGGPTRRRWPGRCHGFPRAGQCAGAPAARAATTSARRWSDAPVVCTRMWGITRYQWLVLFAAWLGWGFDVFDGMLFNYVAPNCIPTLLHLPVGSPEARAQTLHWTGCSRHCCWSVGRPAASCSDSCATASGGCAR
jgi:hypothetical protein